MCTDEALTDGAPEGARKVAQQPQPVQPLVQPPGRPCLKTPRANDLFSGDNRVGLPGTLHRISGMLGKKGELIGLTYRVGRHVPGV